MTNLIRAAALLVMLIGCTDAQLAKYAENRACNDLWNRYANNYHAARRWTLICAERRPLVECEVDADTLYPPVPQPTCVRKR